MSTVTEPSADDAGDPIVVPDLHEHLETLVEFIGGYMVMTRAQLETVALWIVNTHVFDEWDVTPYLGVLAPTWGSGKTRLFEVIQPLVRDGWVVVSPSAAVVYRKVDQDRPTMLIDEIDAVFSKREFEDIRGILNSGFQRTGSVPRVGGKSNDQIFEFSTYCPKALAGIGLDILPSTIRDRTIVLALKKKTKAEKVKRMRTREFRELVAPIAELTELVAESVRTQIRSLEPELPAELDDRAQDLWEPLLALADIAGHEWPERAREIALELSGPGATADDETAPIRLLTDIRSLFERCDTDRVTTAQIRSFLAEDEEAPWGTWHPNGLDKLISSRSIAGLLRQFGIASTNIRNADGSVAKGYYKGVFEDAWERYLVTSAPSAAATTLRQATMPDREPDPAVAQAVAEAVPVTATTQTPTDTGIQPRSSAVADSGGCEVAEADENRRGCLVCDTPVSATELRCRACRRAGESGEGQPHIGERNLRAQPPSRYSQSWDGVSKPDATTSIGKLSVNICPSCEQDFSSVEAFDAHRVGTYAYTFDSGLRLDPPREDGRRCLRLDEMTGTGWVIDPRGRWVHPREYRRRVTRGGDSFSHGPIMRPATPGVFIPDEKLPERITASEGSS